ncbi:MAG: glycine betaine ABC transporter substrate-binding protein [Oscillospiraceae bacterium]
MKPKAIPALLLSLLLLFSLAACGGGSNAATIVIHDGQFSEMKIIHQMVKLLVEEKTDAKVEIKDEMSPVNVYNEMLKGNVDLTNSYDGTVLTTYFHLDPADVPAGTTLYDFVNQQAQEKQIRLLDKLGINNTYAIAVPQAIAEQYNLVTISDLAPVAGELVFGAEHDFFTEEGSAKYGPFAAFYGLDFKEAKPVDLSLKYSAVQSGNLDVVVVYATDGLNRQANLTILEDDRAFFPEYNGALLVREDLFEKMKDTAPNLEEVLNQLGGTLSNDEMVDLTYAVYIDGKTPEAVAKEFLQQKGLLAA